MKKENLLQISSLNFQMIQSKREYGVTGKMKELKVIVQGFYINRNLNITKNFLQRT